MDSHDLFIQSAKRVPLLTPVEEIELARIIQRMLAIQAENPTGPYSRAEKLAIRRGTRARERFITANLRLVAHVAGTYHRRLQGAVDMEVAELMQEGMFGLMRAVEKFDPDRGYKFSTYAYWWIRQAIGRGMKDLGRPIRLPVHIHETMFRLRRRRQELTAELGRPPSREELAASMEWAPQLLDQVLQAAARPASLDAVIGDNVSPLSEVVADERSLVDPLVTIGESDDAARVREALDRLHPRDREIVRMRYGLGGGEPATLQAIARAMGVTRECVRQRCGTAMKRLEYQLRRDPQLSVA
jgi:RNA polymerase sigma factor (sigma-70 family)